jgi:hypothetical protein
MFPKENMHFGINHPRNLATGSRSQKSWKFKYFEIHGIQEKESPVSRSTYFNPYQSDWHGNLPKVEEENIAALNIARSDHRSKRPIGAS